MKKILRLSIIFFFFSIYSGCATDSNDTTAIKEIPLPSVWEFNDWGPDPIIFKNGVSGVNLEEKDWFYHLSKGKANPRAVELNSPTFLQSSCKQDSLVSGMENLVKEAVISAVPSAKEDADLLAAGKQAVSTEEKGVIDCKSSGGNAPYIECECMVFIKIKGGKSALAQKISP